jgi:DNA adenine methylase
VIENLSYDTIIERYDGEDVLFYLDPPYYSTEHYYAGDGFTTKDHKRLRDLLSKIKGKFLLSYNDCPEIRSLYKGFNIQTSKKIQYTLGSNTHKSKKFVNELYISNYKVD